jgi:predicted short-subunit dehydrogenase-like oxidoreductase (DUF2520 family)
MNTPSYGLIGRGRVASHMAHYLELESQPVTRWHRGLPHPPAETLSNTDIILLAISDDALEGFIADNLPLWSRPLVHFSGSRVVDGAHGLHPLMTFGPEIYNLEFYRSIPFVTERGGAGFRELFPGLQNPSWPIDPDDKPLYHALCVLAGNFTTLTWLKAMDDFEAKLGLPRTVLRPYLERTAVNTLEQGREALTGSLARGDRETIARDLDGLRDDGFREVYLAFTHAYAAMGVQS